jgi:ribose transport system ATP-binding protein
MTNTTPTPALAAATSRAHRHPAPAAGAALELRGIVKTFGPVRALTDVTLEVNLGEVHALVGENGAGKSTLMGIASGALGQDAGTVTIGGQLLEAPMPARARALGLGIVRQDPALLPDLTVAENFALGVGYRTVGGLGGAARWAQARLAPWEMGIDARSRVSDLSVEQRFVVEIAKALSLEPRVLILDEPTEHLSLEEVQRLFRRVRELVATGAAVVYISHRIPEVKQIADRITVLRDGALRGTFEAGDVDEQQIVELVIGRALEAVFPAKGSIAGTVRDEPALDVHGLSGGHFANIDLTVRAGEIVGLAGVQGNGQAELIRALAGLDRASGSLEIAGRRVRPGNHAAAARAGAAYVPADRHGEGAFLSLSVGNNTVIRTLPQVASAGLVRQARVEGVTKAEIRSLSIKTPSVHAPVSSLSGGNQQKVVFARTMLARPKVLLAEEPTQGVDAGARVDIYRILRAAADDGAAVVVLSSDGVELEGLCDRVLIMSRGSIVGELVGADVTEESIARAALTATSVRNRGDEERSGPSWRRWLGGDHTPAAVLALIAVILGVVVGSAHADFFSQFNLVNMLFAAAPLIFVGTAQQVVVLGSGIDLSVGPLMGFLVVIASFWVVDGGNLVVGYALMLLAGGAVGLANGIATTLARVNPVVATLGAYMLLQGLYLTLRSTPGGIIATKITDQLQSKVGFVPVATAAAVAVAIAFEVALRRTRWGVELRAIGSRRDAAERLGVRSRRIQLGSYLVCSLLTMPAALLVAAQIGIGDGRPSLTYTLSSITIVVLAGASVFGGRGSFLGIVAAALLLQEIVSASPFLGLSQAWSYWLPGLITIGAAALYAQLRRVRS